MGALGQMRTFASVRCQQCPRFDLSVVPLVSGSVISAPGPDTVTRRSEADRAVASRRCLAPRRRRIPRGRVHFEIQWYSPFANRCLLDNTG